MKRSTIFIAFMAMCYSATYINCDPIAYIGDSQILGQTVRQSGLQANQFLGVPYAEPPVGNLRFMKTEPLKRLPGVLRAVRQPPACLQYSMYPFPWYANTTEKSEDCLYLNIWAPTDASPQNTKAVIYWIHGGSFRLGSIRQDLYSGIALAALGDIVVVTVNYRLGPFGFLTSNTEDAPGNAGFWDLLEGLRWVNRNIQAFGGDPERITIAGESAGSMFAGLLSVSPLSRGLFARQIMQSGSPTFFVFENRTQSVMMTQYAGTLAGCANESYTIYEYPREVIKCLKDMDAVSLGKLDMELFTETTVAFSPQFGDEFMPTNARQAIAKGEFQGTDLLIGVTKDEGAMVAPIFADIFGFHGEKSPNLNKTAAKDLMRKMFQTFPKSEDLLNHYLPDSIPENSFEEIRQRVFASFGDELLICPTVYHAEKTAEKGKNVYFYYFVHRPSTTIWDPSLGVAHFEEVQFVFGQPILNPELYQPEEVRISSQVIEMWSSFVKNGKPSMDWPLYSKDSPSFKYIGSGTVTHSNGMGPQRENCDFLRHYFGF